MVKKRKKRIKDTHKKNGLAKIANLTSKSFGSVLSNYKKNKELEKIKFYTIDNQFYGSISFTYDRLGFVNNEVWVKEPENYIIRRFKYQYDIMAEVKQIWEYNKNSNLISHQTLKHAPLDELYKKPPPRTGNMLSEAGLIIEELLGVFYAY